MSTVRWLGPYPLRHLLEHCMTPDHPWPPEKSGVYIGSELSWSGVPTRKANILYSGGNTSPSPLFAVRVGCLVADALGFGGHHSGGQSLYDHYQQHGLHPLDLYIGWVEDVPCHRCAECEVYEALQPVLCKRRPPRCPIHSTPLRVCFPWR